MRFFFVLRELPFGRGMHARYVMYLCVFRLFSLCSNSDTSGGEERNAYVLMFESLHVQRGRDGSALSLQSQAFACLCFRLNFLRSFVSVRVRVVEVLNWNTINTRRQVRCFWYSKIKILKGTVPWNVPCFRNSPPYLVVYVRTSPVPVVCA